MRLINLSDNTEYPSIDAPAQYLTLPDVESNRSYNREILKEVLIAIISDEEIGANRYKSPELLKDYPILNYLSNYFIYKDETGFYAKTLVVEEEYYSKSFVQDFSTYYSMSHHNHGKFCIRIHFFNNSFDEGALYSELFSSEKSLHLCNNLSKNGEEVEYPILNSYLGYITIKPIMNSLLGASIVRSYDITNQDEKKEKKEYKFTAVKPYEVNLFGRKLIFNSLAFQQQDKAVSACATTALWMAFHKLSPTFSTTIPAPSEITVSSGLNSNHSRNMPNSGLDIPQIIQAIRYVNLDSETRANSKEKQVTISKGKRKSDFVYDQNSVKRFVYAYLKADIPVLIGYRIDEGLHMVTAVGYRMAKDDKEREKINVSKWLTTNLKAYEMCRLYVHDDQLGPFSKIGFDPYYDPYVLAKWIGSSCTLATCTAMVVPVHPLIRVKYEDIFDIINDINILFLENYVWDIFLQKGVDYKRDIIAEFNGDSEDHKAILTKGLPKYVWVATNYEKATDSENAKDKRLFDMVFDATGTKGAFCCLFVHFFNEDFKAKFGKIYVKLQKKIKNVEYREFLEAAFSDKKEEEVHV